MRLFSLAALSAGFSLGKLGLALFWLGELIRGKASGTSSISGANRRRGAGPSRDDDTANNSMEYKHETVLNHRTVGGMRRMIHAQ